MTFIEIALFRGKSFHRNICLERIENILKKDGTIKETIHIRELITKIK